MPYTDASSPPGSEATGAYHPFTSKRHSKTAECFDHDRMENRQKAINLLREQTAARATATESASGLRFDGSSAQLGYDGHASLKGKEVVRCTDAQGGSPNPGCESQLERPLKRLHSENNGVGENDKHGYGAHNVCGGSNKKQKLGDGGDGDDEMGSESISLTAPSAAQDHA